MIKNLLKIFLLLLIFLSLTLPSFAVDYSKFDKNDINSIVKATDAFQKEFKNKRGSKEAEQDYLKFLEFYDDVIDVQSKKTFFEFKAFQNSYEKQAEEYSKEYFPKGMIVHFDEGDFFIVSSDQYLYNEFAPYLSEDWQELMKYETRFDKRIISDWRYRISKSEVQEIISFYQKFLKKYPNFANKEYIKRQIITTQKALKKYPYIY